MRTLFKPFSSVCAASCLLLACLAPQAQAATCKVGYINLGRGFQGGAINQVFAKIEGGALLVGATRRIPVQVNECDMAGYSLRVRPGAGANGGLRLQNGTAVINLVPFLVAVNGQDLPRPLNLLQYNNLKLSGNQELQMVFATEQTGQFPPTGNYAGTLEFEFTTP